jgi:hypothetical protein
MTKLDKIEQIQISNLNELLTDIVGYTIQIDKINVNKRGYISFDSNDLREHTGIMKNFYERFTVSSFSNGFTTGDKEYYWVMVNFSFTYNTGGSNGTTITTVFYDFEKNTWFTQPQI